MRAGLPGLHDEIEVLQQKLVDERRKSEAALLYKSFDNSVLGMKTMVLKMSGFAKFEVDHKLSQSQFFHLLIKLSTVKADAEPTSVATEKEVSVQSTIAFSLERYEEMLAIFKKALVDDECPFKGDLTNETYTQILAALRAHDPTVEPE